MPRYLTILCSLTTALLLAASLAVADEPVKHQIVGLFMPEREADLRTLVEQIPGLELVSVDYANAEALFRYDAAKLFPGAKPEQIVERLDNLLRQASHSTFGAKPLRTTPRDQLTLVEIPVQGLDCKACSLAAYEIVNKLPGVEQATASFRAGLVTALIDPAKTDRAKLEEALKQRGVTLVMP